MTDSELTQVIDFCDLDGRGDISMEDFCNIILQAAPAPPQRSPSTAQAQPYLNPLPTSPNPSRPRIHQAQANQQQAAAKRPR